MFGLFFNARRRRRLPPVYLSTRGRYKGQKPVLVSCLTTLLSLTAIVILIVIGIGIISTRDMISPYINKLFSDVVNQAENTVATIQAPAPTPTVDPTSILQRADLSWEQGLYQDAINTYEQLIDAVPNQDYVHYRFTLGLLMQGRTSEAMEAAENAVTANPFSSNVWAIRSLALSRSGRTGEAIASALRALELQPENTRARAFLAVAYYDAGQGQRALTELERAVEQDPNSYEAYYMRGILTPLITFEGFEQARADLETAYDLSNGNIEIGVTLASEYIFRFEEPELGLDLLLELAERNPENALVLYQLGRYYNRQVGDPNQAATYLNRCVIAVPDNIDCNYELGRVLYAEDDFAGAADVFAKTVDLGTTNPYHYWWAGNAQIDLGNCASAAEFLEPGYQLALDFGDSALITNYNDLMNICPNITGPVPALEITAEATPEI